MAECLSPGSQYGALSHPLETQVNLSLVPHNHPLVLPYLSFFCLGNERGRDRGLYISCLFKKICFIIWLLPNPITSPLGRLLSSCFLDLQQLCCNDRGVFWTVTISSSQNPSTIRAVWSHNKKKSVRSHLSEQISVRQATVFHSAVCLLFIRKLSCSEGITVICFPIHSSHYTFLFSLFQKLFEFHSFRRH